VDGELRSRAGAQPHRPAEVDVNDIVEHLRVVLGPAPERPGAVDQDVEPRHRGEQRGDRLRVAHVEHDRLLAAKPGAPAPPTPRRRSRR